MQVIEVSFLSRKCVNRFVPCWVFGGQLYSETPCRGVHGFSVLSAVFFYFDVDIKVDSPKIEN